MFSKIGKKTVTVTSLVFLILIMVAISIKAPYKLNTTSNSAQFDIVQWNASNHYEVLDVYKTIDASGDELRRAYRRTVRRYHPDKVQRLTTNEQAEAKRKFEGIKNSYEFLMSDSKCFYDRYVMRSTLKQQSECFFRIAKRSLDEAISNLHDMSKIIDEAREERRIRKRKGETHPTKHVPCVKQAQQQESKDILQYRSKALRKFVVNSFRAFSDWLMAITFYLFSSF